MSDESLPNFSGTIASPRCFGCDGRFGDELSIARYLPCMIDFTNEDDPKVTNQFPLCRACAYRWCDDDEFMKRCNQKAVEWLRMDEALRKFQAPES